MNKNSHGRDIRKAGAVIEVKTRLFFLMKDAALRLELAFFLSKAPSQRRNGSRFFKENREPLIRFFSPQSPRFF